MSKTAIDVVKEAWFIDPRVYDEAEKMLNAYADQRVNEYKEKLKKGLSDHLTNKEFFIDLIDKLSTS